MSRPPAWVLRAGRYRPPAWVLQAWAVRIAALDNQGCTLVNELLNPRLPLPAEASRLHGITDTSVARAPSFGDLLPELRGVVKGRRCTAYNARFDKDVVDRELSRLHGSVLPARAPLEPRRWEDAIGPAAVTRGMRLADRSLYLRQPL
ncbi:exonuclease domain-containing protein [Streptomyces sp. LMG1-1-1.1]|uniref:3'-5' exonuclease n=1 Tax=Streptomyces sp. LMG1-1-1.1 TaxID=3135245 RepID=UPI003465E09D